MLVKILDEVKEVLLNDWHDEDFVIGTNPEEMIEVRFSINE